VSGLAKLHWPTIQARWKVYRERQEVMKSVLILVQPAPEGGRENFWELLVLLSWNPSRMWQESAPQLARVGIGQQ